MDEDPGWPLSWRTLSGLVPFVGARASSDDSDGLEVTRSLFLSFCATVVLIGCVVLLIADPAVETDPEWIVAVVVVGIVSLAAVRGFERPLDCASEAALAASYRTRFFVRLAFGETPALFGFVVGIVGGPWWSYYVGLLFTAVAFVRAAPSVGNVAADQQRLVARGCACSLVAALRARPAPAS